MMDSEVRVHLRQQEDYRFEARFDSPALPALLTDEPPPLGGDAGPSPIRLLTLSVANCLAASLLFALRKFKNEPGALRAEATAYLQRNAQNRLRVARIAVDIHLGVPAAELKLLPRILAQYEDYCVVTQSVRAAFSVDVRVFDAAGTLLVA
jgi:uncharacterized OsmC-like protein